MTLRTKLRKLTGDTKQPARWEVWYLDEGWATDETNHPGVRLTEQQLDDLPTPHGWGRIVVAYVDQEPTP